MGRSTVRLLVMALMATDPSYERLCREICDKAGASDFLDQLRAKPAAAGNLMDDAIPSQTALAPLLNALATERQRSLVLQNEMEALKHKRAEPDPDAWECRICMDRKIEVITYPCDISKCARGMCQSAEILPLLQWKVQYLGKGAISADYLFI